MQVDLCKSTDKTLTFHSKLRKEYSNTPSLQLTEPSAYLWFCWFCQDLFPNFTEIKENLGGFYRPLHRLDFYLCWRNCAIQDSCTVATQLQSFPFPERETAEMQPPFDRTPACLNHSLMPLRIVTTKNTLSYIHQMRCYWFYFLSSVFLIWLSLSLVVSL